MLSQRQRSNVEHTWLTPASNTGGPIQSGVITYAVNGKQYVAVASGAAAGFWMMPPASSMLVIFALTVTVERIDGGKLRCTGATWSDAVVIFSGEVLAFQNIERQAHALRAPAPGAVVKDPPAEPDLGEEDFEGVE
jgi:hypothetical protein